MRHAQTCRCKSQHPRIKRTLDNPPNCQQGMQISADAALTRGQDEYAAALRRAYRPYDKALGGCRMKYPPGAQFPRRVGAKRVDLCTVVDYLTTTNLAGEILSQRYLVSREFLGQTVIDAGVSESEISQCLAAGYLTPGEAASNTTR